MTASTTAAPTAGAGGHSSGLDREIPVLAGVIVLGMIMTVLDLTIVNVAIPTLGAGLNASISSIQWVLTGEQWAQRHLGDLHNEKFEVLDPHERTYGDPADTAVEAVQQQATTAMGRDTSGSFRLGLVAVHTSHSWRIAHIQLSGPLIKPGEMPPFAR